MKRFSTQLRPTVFIAMVAMLAITLMPLKCMAQAEANTNGEWQKGPNQNWFIDWNYALAEARTKNKAIFILSTGSDWCGWCKLLRKNVLDQKAFLDFANEKLVLLFLDSPSKIKLCSEQKQHNDHVRQALGFSGGVPHVMIVSHQGDLLGEIGGGGLKLDEYLAKLNDILKSNGTAIASAQGKDLFTKGYLRVPVAIKTNTENATTSAEEAPQKTATKEQFKAKIIGIAVADRNANYATLEFSPVDTHIKVPKEKRVIFQVQYDFPDGYGAYVWIRAVGSFPGMGSNPSRLYHGKGIAYGFLMYSASNAHMGQVRIQTNSSPKIGEANGWTISTQDVNVDFE